MRESLHEASGTAERARPRRFCLRRFPSDLLTCRDPPQKLSARIEQETQSVLDQVSQRTAALSSVADQMAGSSERTGTFAHEAATRQLRPRPQRSCHPPPLAPP